MRVEDFMREYFAARTAVQQRDLENFRPFRERFYTGRCELGQRRTEHLEVALKTTEKVLHASVSGTTAKVVSACADSAGTKVRLRYSLQAADESWLIESVELECPICKGCAGDERCSICEGTGWAPISRREGGGAAAKTEYDSRTHWWWRDRF